MMFVVVPESLSRAINEKLDVAIAAHPNAEADREVLFRQLLSYFNEYGVVPDFTLEPKHK